MAAICAMSLMSLASCGEKVDKNVTWPQWASRPLIEDAVISADGKVSVIAGETVKFTARLRDEINELKEYTLTVKYAGRIVLDRTAAVSGNEVSVDFDFVMPFAAYLDSGYPEVTVTVTNIEGGTASQRLSNERNVNVMRPESPEKLYLVGTNGKYAVLTKADAGSYLYLTDSSDDIAQTGDAFYIAEKLSGNAPDFSALVWGETGDGLGIVGVGGNAVKMPDSSGKGFKKFGFDIYSFLLDKTVDHTVVIDKSAMSETEQNGVNYLAMEHVELVRDCEVIFEGFGSLGAMLQADRFEITGDKTAKFTGHTQDWSVYYDTDDNWMIVNYAVNNTSGQVWVTGTKACFPLGGDDTVHDLDYFAGDGKVRYASLAAVRDDAGIFSILLYLKDEFAIQLYRWVKWSTVISMKCLTPETASITADGIYIRQGSSFAPGLYVVEISITDEGDSNGDGAAADISVKPYNR